MDEKLSPVFEALCKEFSGQRFDMKDPAILGPLVARLGLRADANESIMFARELEYVQAKTYDVLYPELKARTFIPVSSEVPSGAESFTYTQYDGRGEAKEISDYAQDFPNVEVSGTQNTNRVIALGAAYQYSVQDMRAAAFAKKPLDAMKAAMVRKAMEEKIEKIAARGSSAGGVTGLFNAPNVTNETLPTGAWAAMAPFSDEDLLLIQRDVAYICDKIWTDSLGVHGENLTMLLDLPTYALLKSLPQSPTFKDTTVLDFLLRTVRGLKDIQPWNRCTTGDGSSGPIAVVYEKNPECLTLEIPQEFEQFPPQLEGMATKIYCHMRTGGVVVRRPMSMRTFTNHA